MWRNTSFQACYPLLLASLRLSALGQIVHLARHTFATTITLSNDIPIETVSSMMGHANISTTQIYAKVVGKKISKDTEILRKIYAEEKQVIKKVVNQ